MVGIDSVLISRIEKKIADKNFLEKVFTADEIAYYTKKGSRAQTLAGFYCVKEAVSKCFMTGLVGFRLTDIEVTHTDKGAPLVKLSGGALALADGYNIAISITHDGDMATAIAIKTAK